MNQTLNADEPWWAILLASFAEVKEEKGKGVKDADYKDVIDKTIALLDPSSLTVEVAETFRTELGAGLQARLLPRLDPAHQGG